MTTKDEDAMSPNRIPRWPLASMVFMALAGALAGGAVMAFVAMLLGVLSGSWIAAGILFAVLGALGALTGFAIVLLVLIRDRVTASEQRIRALLASADGVPSSRAALPSEAAPAPTSVETPVPRPPESPPSRQPPRQPQPEPPPGPPLAPPEPSLFSRGFQRIGAWLKGGNTIARVGVLVLFIGAALLAKYAAESGLFPLEVRLAAVAVLGMALLGLGWRLRIRHVGYALILQGGGVAILYLTLYAAFRLFSVIPSGLAFSLMVVVALAAAVLAVAQNALILAVIGFAGGFLAPLLTSSGAGSHISLFSYYTVLNLGVFLVAWFRAWRQLNLLGFLFTFGISGLWRGGGYSREHLISTDLFLGLFFLMYVAVSLLFARRQAKADLGYVSGTLVFGLPVVTFGLHASLVSHLSYALAWSALAFALFYLGLALILFYRRRSEWRLLAEAFAALGVIFGSLTVPLALSGSATAAIWAVEGAGLLWLGVRQKRKLARAFGVLLQVLAAGQLLIAMPDYLQPTMPLFNGVFMAAFGLAVAGYASGVFLSRLGAARAAYERGSAQILLAWAVFWALFAGGAEVGEYAPFHSEAGWLLLVPTLIILLLTWAGRWLAWETSIRVAPWLGAGFVAIASLTLLTLPHPLADGALWGWPALWLVYYHTLWLRDRREETLLAAMTPWLHALGLWSLALVLLPELSWRIGNVLDGVWPVLTWGLVPAALITLCARSPGVWPWRRHAPAYRCPGALPLAALAVGWLIWINLFHNGAPSPLPYWPLLNPLDISVALTMLAIIGWWRETPRPYPVPAVSMLAALVFLWLSAALVRALHYGVGTPLDAAGIVHSVTVQMALSLFWALLGLAAMITATRKGWRPVWILGVALLGVVVVKLFLIDMAGTETLARIVSFLGVGLILLVVGYFSPLPPRGKECS
ncbi:DUF2339 domain-containing protein [Alloalcanivorax xenomutans]|uniref:DUF2339 domain-containing protein n=1 Tax=Alloalcanivorax xenomutans TaxID=1094342 RepID=A0A9Q3ZGY8_9GAMM|nr:DUF2339 domain-containing protein [Alloalcanivorax xenomutans]MCE7510104.1 DUF2339 domain-containing protein [Alloalcanivorax xenomutans]